MMDVEFNLVPRGTFTASGRFRVEDLFGDLEVVQGGQGTVYRGVEVATGRQVAIKVFFFVEEARVEWEVGSRVNGCANIIGFFEFDPSFDGGKGAIVMEAATPGAFFDYVLQELPSARARMWLSHIVAGLAHMHGRGVAHLDIKFENMLVAEADDGKTPICLKLADFGQSVASPVPAPSQRRPGTESWRAPEVYAHNPQLGAGYSSFAADAWSVGVAAYCMFLGSVTFTGLEPAMRGHTHGALLRGSDVSHPAAGRCRLTTARCRTRCPSSGCGSGRACARSASTTAQPS